MLWFHLLNEIRQQRNNPFLWSPVAFAIGISTVFSHGHWLVPILFCILLISVILYFYYYGVKDSDAFPIIVLLSVAIFGTAAASFRAYSVWAPTLSYPYYGEVEGSIQSIDRSASGSLRLTIKVASMDPISEQRRPHFLRISFPKHSGEIPRVGETLRTTAYVTPPQGPEEPGGFDFRRHAYFQSLGGVGYARKGFQIIDYPRTPHFWKDRQRILSQFINAHLPDRSVGFAQAIISGDRLNLSLDVIEDLRRTNLAHLLAISGLHMGLLTTVVFGLLRMICVILPIEQLRRHARAIAALGAIMAGIAYLGLSGNSIATQRAFIMIACFFGGVILSRRALTLRSLALAALIILALRPEALFSPGFQMSFAATIALVSAFEVIAKRGWIKRGLIFNYIIGAIVSSSVAGLATAPFAALHFNQISQIGYIANLLAVPVMAMVVAPAAVIALALAPLKLAWIGFWFVDLGLSWIQFVASHLADFELAIRMVKTPMPAVLPLLSFGLVWVILWIGWRGKCIGYGMVVIAVTLWAMTERPHVLIADHGKLIGLLTDKGRALSKEKGQGFVADVWTENDGHRLKRSEAHELWNKTNTDIVHIWSKRASSKTYECGADELYVALHDVAIIGDCLILRKHDFYDFGATEIALTTQGYQIVRRVNKYATPYAWRATSARRNRLIGTD